MLILGINTQCVQVKWLLEQIRTCFKFCDAAQERGHRFTDDSGYLIYCIFKIKQPIYANKNECSDWVIKHDILRVWL